MGSAVAVGYDDTHVNAGLICQMKAKFFNDWITKYLGHSSIELLDGLVVVLIRPLRLRTKCCIFETWLRGAMNLDGKPLLGSVVLKIADTRQDLQTEHELTVLKRLRNFKGVPFIAHESRVQLDNVEYLRVALAPMGQCWGNPDRPIIFQSDEELLSAGRYLLSIMERLYEEYGLLHGDIKPSNIVSVSSDTKPQLIDFGVACDRGDAAFGFSQDYVSEMQLKSDSLDYKPTLWDDMESLLFTLYSIKVGTRNYKRPTLLHVMNSIPSIAKEIAIPKLCALDAVSIAASSDNLFSWAEALQEEISAATYAMRN